MGSLRSRGPVHRSIVVVDIAGSSRWDNPAQLTARSALTRMMRAAFREAGVQRRGGSGCGWHRDRPDLWAALVHSGP
jgi:hypothetical protein